MLSKKFSKKLEEKHTPFFSSLELTSRCNLSCIFCYLNHTVEDELSTEEIKDYLDQLARLGSLILCLTGGEPLLRKDFWEIAHHAHQRSFAINLKTNGTLIDEKAAAKLKDLNIYRLDISLLGATADVHDRITNVRGSFEKTLKAITLLRQNKVNILLMSTIIRDNFPQFGKIQELAKKMGVPLMSTPLIFPSNDSGSKPLKYRLSQDELACYYRHILPSDSRIAPSPEAQESALACQAGRTDITINFQGKVYPCVAFPWEVGDLKKENLKEIIQNSRQLAFFRSLKKTEIKECAQCEHSFLCARCPGLAYLEKGNLLGISPENCRQTKIISEVLNEKEKSLQET